MMFDKERNNEKTDPLRPGPHEFGRPPMHHGHPALHMRNEQQGKLFYGEEGHQVRRTIDKELKPGPVPGMRPTMGGPGIPQAPRTNQGGGGTMGILMPLYTTGIVIFFVYTVMKIMMKKNDESTEGGGLDDRPSRRLHQQLRSQAITPEFMQHQQMISAAAKAAKASQVAQAPQPSQSVPNKVVENPTLVQTNIQPKVGNVTAKPKVSTIMEDQISEEVTREPVILKEKECQESTKIEEINSPEDPRDEQIKLLKERLAETEKAMQMIVTHMAAITTQMPKPVSTNPEKSETNKTEILEKSNSKEEKIIATEKPADLNKMPEDTNNKDAKNQLPNIMSKDSDEENDETETDEEVEEEDITNEELVENLNAIPVVAQDS